MLYVANYLFSIFFKKNKVIFFIVFVPPTKMQIFMKSHMTVFLKSIFILHKGREIFLFMKIAENSTK